MLLMPLHLPLPQLKLSGHKRILVGLCYSCHSSGPASTEIGQTEQERGGRGRAAHQLRQTTVDFVKDTGSGNKLGGLAATQGQVSF